MRILLVSPKVPYPTFGGLELRVFQLFKVLRRRHRISLVCTSPGKVDPDSMARLEEVFDSVDVFPVTPLPPLPKKRRSAVKRLSDLLAPPIDYYDMIGYSEDMRRTIREKLDKGRFDVIHLMGIRMMNYVPDIRHYPSVCDCVDDYVLFCYRTIKYQKGIIDKARWGIDWLTAISYERRFAGLFDEVTVVSPVDAKVMRVICPTAVVSVVPIGVDSDHFRPVFSISREPVLMFSGVMDYEPNVTAVRYFCSAIFPKIKKQIPEARFVIVGRNPDPEVRRLGESVPGVTVTGFVDDIRRYFEQSLIYVAPMKSGSGMKCKILEAWAMGKPVVTTSMGIDGIDSAPGTDILIADTATEFARQAVELLTDENLRRKLAANGRNKVVNKYGWESQADKIELIYRRIVTKRENRRPIAVQNAR